jgi:hypothetical protein
MKSGMVPATVLILPLVAATLLGFLYGPAVQALNPGNQIMTASNHTFQSDTFALRGSIGSLIGPSDDQQPFIVTGSWVLDVLAGNASLFVADLELINANGSGYQTIRISNLTSNLVELHENGTATITGTVDVAVNDTASTPAEATFTVARLKTITITVDTANATDEFSGQPIYGIAEQPQLETASIMTEQETGLGLNNITEKFQLPELPNPFR